MSEIDEILAGYNFDEEAVWGLYKEKFLRRSALDRDAELKGLRRICGRQDEHAVERSG